MGGALFLLLTIWQIVNTDCFPARAGLAKTEKTQLQAAIYYEEAQPVPSDTLQFKKAESSGGDFCKLW